MNFQSLIRKFRHYCFSYVCFFLTSAMPSKITVVLLNFLILLTYFLPLISVSDSIGESVPL